jgi:hypothetical protein
MLSSVETQFFASSHENHLFKLVLRIGGPKNKFATCPTVDAKYCVSTGNKNHRQVLLQNKKGAPETGTPFREI